MTVRTCPNSTLPTILPGDRSGTILGAPPGSSAAAACCSSGSSAPSACWRRRRLHRKLGLEGAWRNAFLAYPFVFLAALVAGAALAALKRDLEAVGVFGLPVVAAVVYYLALDPRAARSTTRAPFDGGPVAGGRRPPRARARSPARGESALEVP